MYPINTVLFDIAYGKRRHPYYIYAPRWIETSAGIKLLHLLCNTLNALGECAYLVLFESESNRIRINAELNTPILTSEIARAHFEAGLTPIAIYSETITGNPLKSPFVVRLIANNLGLLGGPSNFDRSEFIWAYSESIAEECRMRLNRDDIFTMFFHAIDPRDLINMKPVKENLILIYAAKYRLFKGKPELPEISGDYDIYEIKRDGLDPDPRAKVLDLLSRAKTLICYENSAIAMEAILLGTPVILMESEFLQRGIAESETKMLGMRWGFSWENVKSANEELEAAKELYINTTFVYIEQLKNFIELTQEKAKHISFCEQIELPKFAKYGLGARVKLAIHVTRNKGFYALYRITFAYILRNLRNKSKKWRSQS